MVSFNLSTIIMGAKGETFRREVKILNVLIATRPGCESVLHNLGARQFVSPVRYIFTLSFRGLANE